MKTKNFPEKVTRRRASAYLRLFKSLPENWEDFNRSAPPAQLRVGGRNRLSVAVKFLNKEDLKG